MGQLAQLGLMFQIDVRFGHANGFGTPPHEASIGFIQASLPVGYPLHAGMWLCDVGMFGLRLPDAAGSDCTCFDRHSARGSRRENVSVE